MKTAIHKCCSRTVWSVDASKEWAVLQARHLPTSPKETALFLQHWLILKLIGMVQRMLHGMYLIAAIALHTVCTGIMIFTMCGLYNSAPRG